MKVFLGGTTNGSKWREDLIPKLKIEYFNPVIAEWNKEAIEKEVYEREHSDFCLFVITPKMSEYDTITDVIDRSNKQPQKTIFAFIAEDGEDKFTKHQVKSLVATGKMVKRNGGQWCESMEDVAEYLNSKA